MHAVFSKLLLRLCACLPLRFTHLLGGLLGWALFIFSRDLCNSSDTNLRLCLSQQSTAARVALTRQSLIEMGKTITEMGPLWFWRRQRVLEKIKKISGKEHLDNAIAQGKGVLLALPHLGAWEMVGLYCSANHPMTSLYRPPRMAALDSTVRHARERFGATLVPTTTQGVRALYRALGNGELVAILPDQDPRDSGGLFVPFFGIPAYTMTLLARLAKKSSAPVIYSFAERLPRGEGFHLHFIPATWDATQNDIEQSTRQVNNGVEQCIMQCPEQYQWSYKRFRTRPAGEASFYD